MLRALLELKVLCSHACQGLTWLECLHRRQALPVTSCEGNLEIVQRCLAEGLFYNAVRLAGTAYNIKDLSNLGQHTYHLLRNTGPGRLCKIACEGFALSGLQRLS